MQHYSRDDPYEREPLDSNRDYDNSTPPRPPPHGYSPPTGEYYDPAPTRAHHPAAHPDSSFNRMQAHDNYIVSDRSYNSGGSGGYEQSRQNVPTSQGYDNGYRGGRSSGDYGYARPPQPSAITVDADNFGESASGGMAGIAYHVADRNPRNSGVEGFHSAGQVPPPPSRTQMPQQAYTPPTGGYAYDSGYGNHAYDQVSNPSVTGFGSGTFPSNRSHSDPYADDPYQGLSSRHGNNLGVVNPNEIEDDGDDGLHYPKQSQRNSMLSLSHSDRTQKQAIGTAAAVGAGAAGGAAAGGLLRKGRLACECNRDVC